MNSYELLYYPPSAPQQVIPSAPGSLTVQADRLAYEDGVVMFLNNNESNPREPVMVLAVPLELMPIIRNNGPVPSEA